MASFNKAIIAGNLTAVPELKKTQSGVSVCSFTVAVNRRFKEADGTRGCDFINCVAWRQTAEFLVKFCTKGSTVLVSGAIQNRSYTPNSGEKRTVTEIQAEEVELLTKPDTKEEAPAQEAYVPSAYTAPQPYTQNAMQFEAVPDDDDLPF